ncbi:unnamed protein product [Fraxinus pennsylvanica]|uniref:Kinesin motor domain-containing protein n=1 Tax=Fraxinus pennsylvanica TaxID=56036 RepID=A0AAD2A9M7_9LAMI|nr:unnamed protein product [Fraxinus pennsylvanica]
MDSLDDEGEAPPRSVGIYEFVDGEDEPISFAELPIQWKKVETPDGKQKQIFLRGSFDKGLQKIYEQVVAWKFDLSNEKPEISVLTKENYWIRLLNPRNAYENIIRTILITVHCLYLVKRNRGTSYKALWDHLGKVFSLFEPRPSENDLVDHVSLFDEAVKRDATLAKSKVVLRIRPANGLGNGDGMVKKVSEDSVSVGDRTYTFDSVLDSKSSQEDVYQLVVTGLVKDALAGYDTSILAYIWTGSFGRGPPSAMVENGPSVSGLQDIVPRIFRGLFSEIQKEHESSDGKQINYLCWCSFLEVSSEKTGDLLDPTQRNLDIKDDEKVGFYVEILTEEYVSSHEDVTQILIKDHFRLLYAAGAIK